MSGEREWVETVKTDIEATVAWKGIIVRTGYRLPYSKQVFSYRNNSNESAKDQSHSYQTDLLISEHLEESASHARASWAQRELTTSSQQLLRS